MQRVVSAAQQGELVVMADWDATLTHRFRHGVAFEKDEKGELKPSARRVPQFVDEVKKVLNPEWSAESDEIGFTAFKFLENYSGMPAAFRKQTAAWHEHYYAIENDGELQVLILNFK